MGSLRPLLVVLGLRLLMCPPPRVGANGASLPGPRFPASAGIAAAGGDGPACTPPQLATTLEAGTASAVVVGQRRRGEGDLLERPQQLGREGGQILGPRSLPRLSSQSVSFIPLRAGRAARGHPHPPSRPLILVNSAATRAGATGIRVHERSCTILGRAVRATTPRWGTMKKVDCWRVIPSGRDTLRTPPRCQSI